MRCVAWCTSSGGGGRGRERERNNTEMRILCRHLLQILLHFEAMKICPDVETDVKEMAKMVKKLLIFSQQN